MKNYFLTLLILLTININFINAQDNEEKSQGYLFTKLYEVPATSVKNQFRSGTCWSFSGLALVEAEVLRDKKIEIDLSDMWIVRHTYYEKAVRYVRFHGKLNIAGGGAFHDVTNMIKKYGIVPESVYEGLNYGTDKHTHGELDEIVKNYLDAVIKNPNKELSTAWLAGFNAILDTYLGKLPEKFKYEGKEYTPKSFASFLGINPDDYIAITSFTHHPFYSNFIIELPDNWAHETVYNVTLSELEEITDFALKNGYTVAWATDVSEKGFSWRNGLAIVPEFDIESLSGTERERWESLSNSEREKEMYKFDNPGKEKIITQEQRQKSFDNYTTTDDHGMLINGIYKDQNGTEYYKVKNSWDTNNIYNGFLYASKPFFLYKTTNIMINKKAVPKHIAKKLGL